MHDENNSLWTAIHMPGRLLPISQERTPIVHATCHATFVSSQRTSTCTYRKSGCDGSRSEHVTAMMSLAHKDMCLSASTSCRGCGVRHPHKTRARRRWHTVHGGRPQEAISSVRNLGQLLVHALHHLKHINEAQFGLTRSMFGILPKLKLPESRNRKCDAPESGEIALGTAVAA